MKATNLFSINLLVMRPIHTLQFSGQQAKRLLNVIAKLQLYTAYTLHSI